MKIKQTLVRGLVTTTAAALTTVVLGGVAHADGPYRQITNVKSQKCLDVRSEDNYYLSGARVQQYHCTGAQEQQWSLAFRTADAFGRNLYSIRSLRSGWCMHVRNDATSQSQVEQYFCAVDWTRTGTPAGSELWRLQPVDASRHIYNLVNYRSGECLDVTSASNIDSALIQQFPCTGGGNQQFQIASDARVGTL
jgi:Ricin-type beta-trefoil lectin domain